MQTLILHVLQQTLVVVQSAIDARDVEVLGLLGGDFEIERLKRTHFWNEPQKESQYTSPKSWTPVALSPFPLIGRSRKIIPKFSRVEIGSVLDDFLLAREQSHSCHLGDDLADRSPKRPDRQIFIGDYIAQRNAVRVFKCPFQQWFRHFESNKVVEPV